MMLVLRFPLSFPRPTMLSGSHRGRTLLPCPSHDCQAQVSAATRFVGIAGCAIVPLAVHTRPTDDGCKTTNSSFL